MRFQIAHSGVEQGSDLGTDGGEIQLPERSRHGLKQVAVAVLAGFQMLLGFFGERDIVAGFQDPDGLTGSISAQRPTGIYQAARSRTRET
jgi:hypothetical protein